MIDVNSPENVRLQIANLERNLEFVKTSNYTEQEKKDLKSIYRMQLRKHKEKQVSFYSDRLTPKFVE